MLASVFARTASSPSSSAIRRASVPIEIASSLRPASIRKRHTLLRTNALTRDEGRSSTYARALEPLRGERLIEALPGQLDEDRLRLRSALDVSDGYQRVGGRDELALALLPSVEERDPVLEQELSVVRSVARRELERGGVEPRGRLERVQPQRPIAGLAERAPGGLDEPLSVSTGGPRELECSGVMMRDHLRPVLRTAQGLDPLRDQAVLLGPLGARDLAVRDVADEHVAKGVLLVVLDRGATLAPDEALALERVQRGWIGTHAIGERRQGSRPEDLSHHSGVLEQHLLVSRKAVQPRRDDAVHVLRERRAVDRAALAKEQRELLGIQRIAS